MYILKLEKFMHSFFVDNILCAATICGLILRNSRQNQLVFLNTLYIFLNCLILLQKPTKISNIYTVKQFYCYMINKV